MPTQGAQRVTRARRWIVAKRAVVRTVVGVCLAMCALALVLVVVRPRDVGAAGWIGIPVAVVAATHLFGRTRFVRAATRVVRRVAQVADWLP